MVCALALWIAFEFAPAQFWWAELARYVPYPAYLLPAGGALALSLCLSWRWRIAALAVLGLVLGPIMGLQMGGGEAGTGRVRLMTYNIKAYRAAERKGGVAAIAWEVALHDADIIVMQDAGYVRYLLETGSKEALTMFGKRQIETYGQYIIASRFPMRDCTKVDMSFPGERRRYFRCVVNAKGEIGRAHV